MTDPTVLKDRCDLSTIALEFQGLGMRYARIATEQENQIADIEKEDGTKLSRRTVHLAWATSHFYIGLARSMTRQVECLKTRQPKLKRLRDSRGRFL